jgi:hypothetical protein
MTLSLLADLGVKATEGWPVRQRRLAREADDVARAAEERPRRHMTGQGGRGGWPGWQRRLGQGGRGGARLAEEVRAAEERP